MVRIDPVDGGLIIDGGGIPVLRITPARCGECDDADKHNHNHQNEHTDSLSHHLRDTLLGRNILYHIINKKSTLFVRMD